MTQCVTRLYYSVTSTINPIKSQFGVPILNFLGHIVDKSVHAIRDFPVISSVRKLREFLGLVNIRIESRSPTILAGMFY